MTEAAPRTVVIEHTDVRRSAVLYSNLRSGSNLLKSTLHSVGGIIGPPEIFNYENRSPGALRFNEYIQRPDTDVRQVLLSTESALPLYFRDFFESLPRDRPVLIDLKYSQAYALGVDYYLHVPLILKILISWGFPVIHLVRRDVISQALSHLVAMRTGTYVEIAKEKRTSEEEPRRASEERFWLDPDEVLRVARAREWAATAARQHLELLGARSITVLYEDLIGQDSSSHYRRCLRFLGVHKDVAPTNSPHTVKQNSAKRVANVNEIMQYISASAPEIVHSYLGTA